MKYIPCVWVSELVLYKEVCLIIYFCFHEISSSDIQSFEKILDTVILNDYCRMTKSMALHDNILTGQCIRAFLQDCTHGI